MSMKPAEVLEETVIELLPKVGGFNRRHRVARPTEQRLWEELVACILGSRVLFETAYSAFRHLKHSGYLSLHDEFLGTIRWRARIARELHSALYLPRKLDGTSRRYPFPYLRSNHILKSWKLIYGNGTKLSDLLSEESQSRGKRAMLVDHSFGIGPKQASLLLRNLCLADDIAILDSHVLRYMTMNKMIKTSSAKATGLHVYELIEERLQRYAESLKTTLAELDIAIWVTMRVYRRKIAV